MADHHLDRVFAALLTPEADDAQSTGAQIAGPPAQPLPSVNERVQLFLRATYGDARDFTVQERTTARNQILDAMAASLPAADRAEFSDERPFPAIAASIPARAGPSAVHRLLRPLAGLAAGIRDALFVAGSGPILARRIAFASAVTLMIVGVGWSLAWLYAARTMETAIARWIDSEAKSGRAYACDARTAGGFPFTVEVTCAAAKATIVSGRATFVVDAKEVRTAARVLQPGVLATNIIGPVTIAEAGGPAAFLGNWAAARMVVHAASNRLEQISVVLDAAQFYRLVPSGMEPLLTGDRLELGVRRDLAGADDPVFAITAQVDAGAIQTAGPIASQGFKADVRAVLHDPDQATAKPIATWVRDWQAAGGHLEIKSARVEQGEAVGSAVGDVRLNARGRVDGHLRVAAGGPYAQLARSFLQDAPDGAAERERIAQGLRAGGRLHSRALGQAEPLKPDIDSPSVGKPIAPAQETARGAGSLEVPIRFVNGVVYLGDRPLGVLPPLF